MRTNKRKNDNRSRKRQMTVVGQSKSKMPIYIYWTWNRVDPWIRIFHSTSLFKLTGYRKIVDVPQENILSDSAHSLTHECPDHAIWV